MGASCLGRGDAVDEFESGRAVEVEGVEGEASFDESLLKSMSERVRRRE